ncbi:MAG: PAS domain S-box protein [Chitinophagaceae bacterium]|nr:PAS domain S-box protein [Chitinophagaceae bacterium]
MVYSLRSLLLVFAIIIAVVLLILLHTFSALRSQEKEQVLIEQSRTALQKLGPAIIHVKEFESVALRYLATNNERLLERFNKAAAKLQEDSAGIAFLADHLQKGRKQYLELARIIHELCMFNYRNTVMQTMPGSVITSAGHDLPLANTFITIASALENEHRLVLNNSYSNSVRLTRETFSFVRILSVLIALIMVISAWFIYRDITNTRVAGQKLKEFSTQLEKQVAEKTAEIRKNEEKYRSLFETMMDAYAKTDMTGRIIEFNPAFRNMIGYPDEEILQLNYRDITPPKWYEMETRIGKEQILVRGFSDAFEKEYIHKSGKVFPVELRGFLIKNETGDPVGVWAIIRDISARKEAEKKIEESERNLRHVLTSMSDNFYVIDRSYRVILINEVAQRNLWTAWGKEVTIGSVLLDMIPGAKDEPIRESLEKVFSGERVEYELNLTKKELPAWVMVTYTPVTDENNVIIGACITAKDITQRKMAEEEMIRANERFSLVSQATHDAVWDWDMVNDQNWGNVSFREFYGLRPDETWKYETFLSRLHPDDRSRIEGRMITAIKNKGQIVSEEFRFRMPDGGYRHFYDRAYIMYDKEGKPVRMLGSMMDVTEKYRLEQEILNQKVQEQKTITRAVLNAEEKERNKIGRELHDNVNQILASTKLFVKMAGETSNPDELKLINRAVELLDSAIEEIRLLSQNQVTPVMKVDLKEMIQAIVDRLDDSTSIHTVFEYTPDKVIDDDLKLNIYRIIQEQVNNILKYANASEISIRITTAGEILNVVIEDNGKGFDPLAKRTGIGISNMINRVESFNGELKIISSPGNGCKIGISIPC